MHGSNLSKEGIKKMKIQIKRLRKGEGGGGQVGRVGKTRSGRTTSSTPGTQKAFTSNALPPWPLSAIPSRRHKTPLSVTIAVISLPGVTSNAGFQALMPSGAIFIPATVFSSDSGRSSMMMSAPVAVCQGGGCYTHKKGQVGFLRPQKTPCRAFTKSLVKRRGTRARCASRGFKHYLTIFRERF